MTFCGKQMSTTDISIRRVVENDAEAVLTLLFSLGYPNIERASFVDVFHRVLQHPEMVIYLAIDGSERVLGMLSLSHRLQLRLAGTLLSIDELAVLPEVRGHGIGQQLLSVARDVAKELGAKRIELHTNRNRESYKRQFYIKNGFIEANSALIRMDCE